MLRLIFSLLLVSSVPAIGESENIFRKGSWRVDLVKDDEGGWCEATTTNRANQRFDLTAFADGLFTVFVFDDRWNIAERRIQFTIDVDYKRWNMSGSGRGNHVSVSPKNTEATAEFLIDLQQGSAVAVYNDDEYRLATFSLAGSSAAIDALMSCWNTISNRGPAVPDDPFLTDSDPFI